MKARAWTIYDGQTASLSIKGPDIAYAEIVHVIEAAPVLAEIEALKKELACLYSVLSEDKMSEWKECYTQWFAALELKEKRK